MIVKDTILDTLKEVCKQFENAKIDYRITGVIASNIYGRGLSTNVIDIAVASDAAVYEAVKVLNLPEVGYEFDPYVHKFESVGGFIRLQGDVLGEPFIHPEWKLKIHNKELLLERLDIYGYTDPRVAEQAAFIALTLDDEKIKKYKHIWNVL